MSTLPEQPHTLPGLGQSAPGPSVARILPWREPVRRSRPKVLTVPETSKETATVIVSPMRFKQKAACLLKLHVRMDVYAAAVGHSPNCPEAYEAQPHAKI